MPAILKPAPSSISLQLSVICPHSTKSHFPVVSPASPHATCALHFDLILHCHCECMTFLECPRKLLYPSSICEGITRAGPRRQACRAGRIVAHQENAREATHFTWPPAWDATMSYMFFLPMLFSSPELLNFAASDFPVMMSVTHCALAEWADGA